MRFALKQWLMVILGSFISLASIHTSYALDTTTTGSTTGSTTDTTGSTTGGTTITDNSYLKQIADNTYNILSAVNNIPTYLGTINQMAQSWLGTDSDPNTSFIAKTQSDFASLGYWFEQNKLTQNNMQANVMASLTHQPLEAFTKPADSPAILTAIANINDLSYSTTLGFPPVPAGASTPYNYITTAAGMSLFHTPPSFAWSGNPIDISRYSNYYNTVMSIASFNGYALSALAADSQNGNPIAGLQTSLINQASSSSWLAEIATEDLGKLLRQILLFESQAYVLQTQALQIQKQILTSQTMTNTLLIMNNYDNEMQMMRKAKGLQPRG